MSSEIRKEENERSRVSIAIGDFKVDLEGTHANVISLMGTPLYEFIRELQNVVGEIPSEETEIEKAPPKEYPPQLAIGKPKNASEAITALMQLGWGREPRAFGEIKNALETNGIYFSKGTLAGTLNYLVKKGTLRRLGTRGNFKYVSA